VDARVLNWTFLVPSADRPLVLPIDQERPDGAVVPADRSREAVREALAGGPYGGVAAPALARWRQATGGDSAVLLERLAQAVAEGGWLYVGFPNAWYPAHAGRGGSLSAARVGQILAAAGLESLTNYLAFPHERTPAYLIAEDDPAALRYFLERLSFPYVEGGDRWRARAKQLVLAGGLRAALAAPDAMRSRFSPGLAVVARRPS
jgi:hypothetical protein